ncbi:hypothetical protein AOXY_G33790 [Acipenser oxyrinchus oxyrinchus]|uniref:Uncharacterized protein n=1 Tax=Acipenser oxyrinchus oxyrinchus TaxID=40147 RepID=A0AAD8CFP9_ACIOX|nr:hypothetical protein AOXY_G33790 [Acipenser oxyrinchus oxyrinchus]
MAKFALVSWIGNGEGGRFSTINTSWIRGFDPSNLTKVYLMNGVNPKDGPYIKLKFYMHQTRKKISEV